jgi:beta-lactamase superfamily II metal-dependent hydrolase
MIMDKLRVRVYNVRFGDAILITVPEQVAGGGTEIRHILFDVGNAKASKQGGEGHDDRVFAPVVKDIVQELNGRPLDLYVMTHEHWDHVQGLPYADKNVFPDEDLKALLQVRHSWFSGSAAPDYYDHHPEAQTALAAVHEAYAALEDLWQADPERADDPFADVLMINNNPNATASHVDYLRMLADEANTHYVHRPRPEHAEDSLAGKHPFQELRLSIWAPEEDTADYYAKLQPMALNVTPGEVQGGKATLTPVIPPSGVDAGAFYDLVSTRQQTFLDNLLAIDKAKNNTSLVILLEWRGWKLLFPADAEKKSWRMMDQHHQLEEVHFLKVSHHGSDTGMPPAEMLDKILPGESQVAADGRPRYAVVSTAPKTYSSVPDEATLDELRQRCTLFSTKENVEDAGHLYIDLEFEGGGNTVSVRTGGSPA